MADKTVTFTGQQVLASVPQNLYYRINVIFAAGGANPAVGSTVTYANLLSLYLKPLFLLELPKVENLALLKDDLFPLFPKSEKLPLKNAQFPLFPKVEKFASKAELLLELK